MVVGDDVSVRAHTQLRGVDAARVQGVELCKENGDVDNHTVGDHGGHAGGQNTGGEQVEGILLIANNDGVAGVVSAVELHNVIDTFSKKVGSFTLTFVAPLGTNQNDCWHDDIPSSLVRPVQLRPASNSFYRLENAYFLRLLQAK